MVKYYCVKEEKLLGQEEENLEERPKDPFKKAQKTLRDIYQYHVVYSSDPDVFLDKKATEKFKKLFEKSSNSANGEYDVQNVFKLQAQQKAEKILTRIKGVCDSEEALETVLMNFEHNLDQNILDKLSDDADFKNQIFRSVKYCAELLQRFNSAKLPARMMPKTYNFFEKAEHP